MKLAGLAVIATALMLSGCGTKMGDRMASGAAIGAGVGAFAGGVGAIPGALVGAAVAAVAPPENVNLGEPVWDNLGALIPTRASAAPAAPTRTSDAAPAGASEVALPRAPD